jgi:hypothetical protein
MMSMLKKSRITIVIGIALLPLLVLSMQAFGQSTTSIGGTITDVSKAVIPNVNVTVTNVDTGISTSTVSNSSGYYNFPSLQPGNYKVVAEAKTFQKTTKTDVKLGVGAQVRMNIEMLVSGGSTEVEVTSSAENMTLDQSSSTGTIMQEGLVQQLPLASNDVMELLNVMGGVVKNEGNPVFGASNQTFAGVAGTNVNIQRDGIGVSEVRYNSGINSTARINPELVGEMKMIISPVDAEMGRGAGQVQIVTKSGSNAFRGSAVWNNQNSALDALEWDVKTSSSKARPDWRNLNDYTLSLSGPIIKNKTFFFVSWEQQLARLKMQAYPRVYTNCARLGIFRYLSNPTDNSGYYSIPNGGIYTGAATNYKPGVDANGTPVTDATTVVRAESVLGKMTTAARNAYNNDPVNCSDPYFSSAAVTSPQSLVTTGTAWDAHRTTYDTTGYISKFTNMMPKANYFGTAGLNGGDTNGSWYISDGLNVAKHAWTRVTHGLDTMWGIASDNDKKAITTKVDHNISNAHRISGMFAYERNFGGDAYQLWPNGYGGSVERYPINASLTLTSTLKPTLLNEFRFGYSRTLSHTFEPTTVTSTGPKLKALLKELSSGVTANSSDANQLVLINAGDGGQFSTNQSYFSEGDYYGNSHVYGGRNYNLTSTQGGKDPRWSLSDTITWTKGTHAFKGGVEFRHSESFQEQNGNIGDANTFPTVNGGVLSGSAESRYTDRTFSQGQNDGYWVGAQGKDLQTDSNGVLKNAQGMLSYLTGSVSQIRQYFYVNNAKSKAWNDVSKGQDMQEVDLRGRELSFFFKDDWKVSSSLTLNLGVRYEYYGVPWVESGMTAALKGGANSAFGISGRNFNNWMPTGLDRSNSAATSQYIFVGPNSPNPDVNVWEKDKNNFAPHVGFAWQLPWFGKGKTTLRGGYSISYSPVGNYDTYGSYIAKVPGVTQVMNYSGGGTYTDVNGTQHSDGYIDLSNVGSYLPMNSSTTNNFNEPLTAPNTNAYASGGTVYANNIRNPYVQSINLSMTRNVGNNITVDVRYIGTLSRKTVGSINVNTVNLVNSGMGDVLKRVRTGSETSADITYLNQFIGYNHTNNKGYLASSVTNHNPADQLRASTALRDNLIQGNFAAIANALATGNGEMSYAGMSYSSGTYGNLSRQSCIDAGVTTDSLGCSTTLISNPQFQSMNVASNLGHSNYHSMQTQVTMRPVRGLSFQATYTWSRNLADSNPNDWSTGKRQYYLSSQNRSHQLTTYGTYDLPMGANGFIFRNAGGALKKAIEGWQMSWVASLSSGAPLSVTGNMSTYWGDTNVNLVDPSFNKKGGKASFTNKAGKGYYYSNGNGGSRYITVTDNAMCEELQSSLVSTCKSTNAATAKLQAVALSDDGKNPVLNADGTPHLVFRNAEPMTHGNFGQNQLTGPGKWSLDMALGKSVEFMEGKRIELRIDAQNILNHAVPSSAAGSNGGGSARYSVVSDPSFTLASFGGLTSKAGHRTFQAKIRISF